MKTIKYIAAGLAIIAAASCQKDQTPEQTQEQTVTITASFAQAPESKVVLGDTYTGTDGNTHHPVLWYGTEEISVFDITNTANGGLKYTGTSDEASETMTFIGSGLTVDSETTYYSVYPYYYKNGKGGHSISGNTITFYNNTTDNALMVGDGNIAVDRDGHKVTMAAAKTTGNTTFTFHQLMALIKITIQSQDIEYIYIKDNNGSKLAFEAGKNITIDCSGSTPVISNVSEATKGDIYFYPTKSTAKDGTYHFSTGTYYIPVLPVDNFKPRIRLFKDKDTYKELDGTTAIDLEPGMILDLGTFTSEGRVTE